MKHNSSPTDWLRRNWPDLIIGLALIAVIAGIVMTLLSGGAMLQFGSSSRPSSSTSREAPPITLAPSSQSLSTQSEQNNQSANNSSSASATSPANSESSASAVQSAPSVQPVIPGQATNNQSGGQSASNSTPAPAVTSPAAATPATPAPASPAQNRSGDFVISVGAFRNPDNADNQAQQFRAQGYNVIRSQQGEWALVFVGPYTSQAEADRVASQIRGRGHAATVYGPSEGSAAANLSAAATSSPAATSPAASSPAASNAASGESRFLQVGAYAVRESSFPQRERLERLGFSVIERTNSNGLLVLLVGPFNDSQLASARARLDTEGIDHFTTR